MQHIGITGGIGSGKSTVCAIFSQLGVPIYNSDERAKWLITNQLEQSITKAFGADVFINHQLQRKVLAERAFSSEAATAKLNAIVHPAVAEDYKQWAEQQKAAYTIKEAALLIEAKSYLSLDALILVTAPKSLRISRVQNRDNSSVKEIEARMDKQLSDEEKLPFAQYIITNDGKKSLIKQVLKIHTQILANGKV